MQKLHLKLLFTVLVLSLVITKSMAANWDKELLKTANKGDLEGFSSALDNGANPNAIFGKKPKEWVMCAVVEKGRERFLQEVIERGGDINLRNTNPPLNKSIIQAINSAPIFCTIIRHNMAALDILLENDVKLDVLACRDCKPFLGNKKLKALPRWNNDTPITAAAKLNEYGMVYKMLKKRGTLWDEELKKLILLIERGRIDLNSEKNKWRIEVVIKLRTLGHKVQPWRKQ